MQISLTWSTLQSWPRVQLVLSWFPHWILFLFPVQVDVTGAVGDPLFLFHTCLLQGTATLHTLRRPNSDQRSVLKVSSFSKHGWRTSHGIGPDPASWELDIGTEMEHSSSWQDSLIILYSATDWLFQSNSRVIIIFFLKSAMWHVCVSEANTNSGLPGHTCLAFCYGLNNSVQSSCWNLNPNVIVLRSGGFRR